MNMRKMNCLSVLSLLVTVSLSFPAAGGADSRILAGSREGPDPLINETALSEFYQGSIYNTRFLEDLNGDGYEELMIQANLPDGNRSINVIELRYGTSLLYDTYEGYLDDIWVRDLGYDGSLELLAMIDSDAGSAIRVYNTTSWDKKLDTGYFPGTLDWFTAPGQFVLVQRFQTGELILISYSSNDYQSIWVSDSYPNGYPLMLDIDANGIQEVLISTTWNSGNASLILVDIEIHEVLVNISGIYDLAGITSHRSKYSCRDLDGDGDLEIVVIEVDPASGIRPVVYDPNALSLLWEGDWSLDSGLEQFEFEDLDGDGTDELVLYTRDPSVYWKKYLTVFDCISGQLLIKQYIEYITLDSCYRLWDINSDGDRELFIYNLSNDMRKVSLRAVDGTSSWSLLYNVTLDFSPTDNLWFGDYTKDGSYELLLRHYKVIGSDRHYKLALYDPEDLTLLMETPEMDAGPDGYANVRTEDEGDRLLLVVEVDYRNVSTMDHARGYVFDMKENRMLYDTGPFAYDDITEVKLYPLRIDEDDEFDFVRVNRWENTAGRWATRISDYPTMNFTIIEGGTHDTMWESVVYTQADNYFYATTIDLDGAEDELYVQFSNRTPTGMQNHHMVFDTDDLSGDLLFNYTGDSISILPVDVDSDPSPEMVIMKHSYPTEAHFVQLNDDGPLTYIHNLTLDVYGSMTTYCSEDGEKLLEIKMGRDRYLNYYSLPEFELLHDLEAPMFILSIKEDIDRNGIDDKMIYWNDMEEGNYTGFFMIIDLEIGSVLYEIDPVDHSIVPYLRDVNNDMKTELIMVQQHIFGSGKVHRVSVNSIYTNLEPEVISHPPDVEVEEDSEHQIDLALYFRDDLEHEYTFQDTEGVLEWELDGVNETVLLRPEENWSGSTYATITLYDGQHQLDVGFWFNVTPVNDHFILHDIGGLTPVNHSVQITANQEAENRFRVNATDVDGDEVYVYGLLAPLPVLYNDSSGEILFTPYPVHGPVFDIWFNITDGNGSEDSMCLMVSVDNVNHLPWNLTIVSPMNGSDLENPIDLSGAADDLDIPWGDTLNFSWHSDVDGLLGYGRNLSGLNLSIGTHMITMRVSDSSGSNRSLSVSMRVITDQLEPHWWDSIKADEIGSKDLAVEIGSLEVKRNGTTISYEVEGTCSAEVAAVHIYSNISEGDGITHLMPFEVDGAPLSLVPSNGTWSFSYTWEVPPTASPSVYDQSTFWFTAVGWDGFGGYDVAHANTTLEFSGTGEQDDDDDDGSDSTGARGALIGLVVTGAIVLLLLIAVVIVVAVKNRDTRSDEDWGEE